MLRPIRVVVPPVAVLAGVAALAAFMAPRVGAQSAAPPELQASEILPAALVRSPYHELRDEIGYVDGFLTFRLESDFGVEPVESLAVLRARVKEVGVMSQALNQFKVSEQEFLDSIRGRQGVGADDVTTLLANPIGTAGQLAGNFGENLNRTLEGDYGPQSPLEQVQTAKPIPPPTNPGPQERAAAFQFDLDPYSRNPSVQAFVARVASARTSGNLEGAIATLPQDPLRYPAIAGGIPDRRVASRVKNEPREELLALNADRLRTIGIPASQAEALQATPAYLPRQLTQIAEYLPYLENTVGLPALVAWLLKSASVEEAWAAVDAVRLLVYHHLESAPFTTLVADTVLPLGLTGEQCVAVLPFDYLASADAEPLRRYVEQACIGKGEVRVLTAGYASPALAENWRRSGLDFQEAYSYQLKAKPAKGTSKAGGVANPVAPVPDTGVEIGSGEDGQ